MADETATFAVNLEDGTSGPAEAAAQALGNLKSKIDADSSALAGMQKALRNLKQATTPNTAQIGELSKQIAAQKESIAGAQSSFLELGGTFGKSKRGAQSFQERLAALSKTSAAMPGPLGGMLGSLSKLWTLLKGNVMTVALVGIAAGMLAVTAAAAAAAVALLKYGIANANARRNEGLQLEGLTKMRNLWGLAAGNSKDMQAAIDKVAGSTALGRDKLVEYTSQLYKAGVRGKNLESALEGAAVKGAALGDEAAKGFIGFAAGANLAGRSVQKLTDDVKARFGGVAAKKLLDLDVQLAKLHENFSALFDNLGIDGLLKAIHSVTSLFSTSTRSGQALQKMMSVIFQPMVNAIEAAMPYVKRFFQGIIIGGLMVTIALLKVRRWWRETFGGTEITKSMDLTTAALYAGVAAVGLFGIAIVGACGIAVAALVAAAPFIWAAVAAVGALALQGLILAAPFILGAIAIGALIAAGYQLYRLWKEIDWTSLGTAIVEGIVGGLKDSAAWLIDSVSELGKSALDALKSTLGIASPSKAFARLGATIPQGVAAGITAGKPEATRAVEELVDVPTGAGGARGGITIPITLGGITITTSGAGASDLAADLERELVPVFERLALQIGAALPRGAG